MVHVLMLLLHIIYLLYVYRAPVLNKAHVLYMYIMCICVYTHKGTISITIVLQIRLNVCRMKAVCTIAVSVLSYMYVNLSTSLSLTHTHTHTCAHPTTHTCTASGEVFTWGSGQYGRLGHGNMRDRFSPLMIGGILRGVGITFIACHEFHSVAVAGEREKGEERGKGRGREGGRGGGAEGEIENVVFSFCFQMEESCLLGVRVVLTLAMNYQTVSPSSFGLRRWTSWPITRSSMYHVENLTH